MTITLKKHRNIDISLAAPPSKSYTHRALIASGLAEGESMIKRPLRSGDTSITASALEQMGVPLAWDGEQIDVTGTAGRPACDPYSTP